MNTTTTATDSAAARTLLALMWLASPALPVGGFSYSEGLETAVDDGRVRGAQEAQAWLLDHLALVIAPCEWPVLRWAHAAWVQNDPQEVQAANDWVLHTRESQELRLQTEQMGRSMAAWLAPREGVSPQQLACLRGLPGGPTWPVAFALAAHSRGADAGQTLLSHGFGWAENQVQAAIKCIPLGQAAGQAVLEALVSALPTAVEAALAQPLGRRRAFAPGLAILSARHETQYSRLFRS